MVPDRQREGTLMLLKKDTELVGARSEYGREIPTYDDYGHWMPVWVVTEGMGTVVSVIRAATFGDAWEIMLDESPTIPHTEVYEAYGCESQDDLDAMVSRADSGDCEYPELLEGYELQANCTGTGIVSVGHYRGLCEYSKDMFPGLRLEIRRYT